jgi:antiviral helicase SKI2
VPFWPGGLEDASSGIPEELEDELVAEGKGIRTIPPGFTRGLRLPGEEEDEAGLDGLDRIQKSLAVGQGDLVSILSEPLPNLDSLFS